MILEPYERSRFIQWLAEEADSCQKIAEQADKLGVPPEIGKIQRSRATVCLMVKKMLEDVEVQTIE